MDTATPQLPVDRVRGEVLGALERGPVVLSSPTGSGKSTQVPRWCPGPVLVVEPRRVACRSLAQRVAALEGTDLGDGVGYRVRDERRAGPSTRILFATPGVVLRLFDRLDRFATVIVDEFHERGLEVDLLLALLLERRRAGAEGRLVIMSATLDAGAIARHVCGAAIEAEGRAFPVAVRHLPGSALLPDVRGLEDRVRQALVAAAELPGDVPGDRPGVEGGGHDHQSTLRPRPATL
ncbi:MAG: DEAD/DEAH box helicase, partial [Acidobacteriota bacterium]